MDDGDELVWSLIAGILYVLGGIAFLAAAATGIDLVLAPEWSGDRNDVRVQYAIISALCSVAFFGATRLGWYFVERARKKQQDSW